MADKSELFLYQKVEKAIRSAIQSGQYAPGQRLPDERQLAHELNVSRATVSLAIRALSKENLVDRIQGRGSFVSSALRRGKYVCLLATGFTATYNPFVGLVTACAEKSLRSMGLQLSVRFLEHQDMLASAIRQVEQDSTVYGAIQVGRIDVAQLIPLIPTVKIPWVRIGEFFDNRRHAPVIDQVVGDSYLRAHALTQYLAQQGIESAALLISDTKIVWARETVDGFHSALDAAGIPTSRQRIIEAIPSEPAGETKCDHDQRYIAFYCQLFRDWDQKNAWPDAIVMDGTEWPFLWEAQRRHPQYARQLDRLAVGLLDFEEAYENRPWMTHRPRLAWSIVSVSQLTELAVSYLTDSPGEKRMPRRTYLRNVRVIPFQDETEFDHGQLSAVTPLASENK